VLQSVATSLESPQIAEIEQPARRHPLHALTTLRFIAAIYVVLFHRGIEDLFSKTSYLNHFFHSGYTGVTLFFVLSGFILAYNYPVVTERRRFWVSRFARVYPVYLLAFLLALPTVVLLILKTHESRLWVGVPESLLLVQAWDPQTSFLINGPSWTLSVEAFFYAAFPFLLPIITRASRRAIAAFVAINLLVALIPTFATDPGWRTWWTTVFLGALPILRIGPFVVGMAAGVRYRTKGPASSLVLWGGVIATILVLTVNPPLYLYAVKDVVLTLTFSALVYGLANARSIALTHPFALLLGEISYGVYILQLPMNWLMRKVGLAVFHHDLSLSTPLYVAVLLVSSYLSYRFVETPCRVWIRKSWS
jgi:peptidoglycan/LPS O-acetylase OafA/YrhL